MELPGTAGGVGLGGSWVGSRGCFLVVFSHLLGFGGSLDGFLAGFGGGVTQKQGFGELEVGFF